MKTLEPQPRQLQRTKFVRTIAGPQRDALAAMVAEAREAKGWSRPQLARFAMRELRASGLEVYGIATNVAITAPAITKLETAQGNAPLGTAERRARLLGVALALELDRREVNLIAGGI